MKEHNIKSKRGHNIFAAKTKSFKECLEQAVTQNINLSGANLSFQDLSNAQLDGAKLEKANFKGSNLNGTNLSEAALRQASFNDTDLYNTCFSESDLSVANFEGANFGGTLINHANLTKTTFSTLSCFTLDFSEVTDMEGCIFKTSAGIKHAMSFPPIVILGLCSKPYIILENSICHGHKTITSQEWLTVISNYFPTKTMIEDSSVG